MGVALGGADLGVTQQPPDHFQRCAARYQQGREGVTQVVDADVGDVGLHAHPLPEALEIDDRLARDIAGEQERAALRHGIVAQPDQSDSLVRNWHAVDPPLLGVSGLFGPDCQIEIELFEGRGPGLAAAGTGQHAEANDPGGALVGIGAERVREALDFLKGQEPLAGRFGALAEAGGGIVGAHFPRDSQAEHLAQNLTHAVGPDGRRLECFRRGRWFRPL